MKRLFVFFIIAVLAAALFGSAGCSFVREGVTGEKPDDPDADADADVPAVSAAHNIIGDWFGVFSGTEYISARFTADGKCELQTGLYQSEFVGPRYYGDYHWGGGGGDEIFLDMYKGAAREVDYGEGNVWEEWSDGGRDAATTALIVSFRVFGGQMTSVALKAEAAGIDTDGYTVIPAATFVVLNTEAGGAGHESPFIFGSMPYDNNEGKTLTPKPPDTFAFKAERFFTTAELNVRCGPSTDFGTYGTVPPGTPVDKIASMASGHDEWAFILLNNGGGWVHTDYLAESPPAPETNTDTDADTNTE